MRDRIEFEQMPKFWPPKPSAFWDVVLGPVHRRILHRMHGIAQVDVVGMERIAAIDPADGILLCPNHSYTGDGSVMLEVGRRMPRRLYIMAAWHAFRSKLGITGAMLQRMGVFSVDREGCDRRAMKQAGEILTTGQSLCIFPEGEIYHTNERLTPLREGVAFIAASAQRDLEKAKSPANVQIVPVAIRHQFVDSIMPQLMDAMSNLEKRVMLAPKPELKLHERIIRFGEMALTIQEKQHIGQGGAGELSARIKALAEFVLAREERRIFGKTNGDDPIPVRVKLLRQKLLESVWESEPDPGKLDEIRAVLADVHLALQLYSYPGDYLLAEPSVERMAETIEKFEEDVIGGYAKPKGARRSLVTIGEPINVRPFMETSKMRAISSAITTELETRLKQLMSSAAKAG